MSEKVNQGNPPPRVGVRLVEVEAGDGGRRVDNLIGSLVRGVPKPLVYRWLRRGEVRVNGGRVKPDHRVHAGDQIRLPPWQPLDEPDAAPAALLRRLDAVVIYQGDGLLVINKPAGVPVHGGSGLPFGVIEILRQRHPDWPYLELVHRLDRATSGCLMLATDPRRLRQLHEHINSAAVTKAYLALLSHNPPWGQRQVRAALLRDVSETGISDVRVDADGKAAETDFSIQERFSDCCLADVRIGTGRTHQIRVHAAHIGHPICGDERYGGETSVAVARKLGLGRLFLHAARLQLTLPGEPKRHFEAPLPDDLNGVLQRLRRTRGES